ncbi:MAG TPA: TIGR03790 family protein [Planctomycetota bacterium]|nr:TIGR03790 family protein [Planctomycetota bacterium]
MPVPARRLLSAGRLPGVALLLVVACGAARPLLAQLDPWDDPSRVLVIHNTSWPDGDGDGVPDSTEVAEYYALRRGVPAGNLLGLPLTPAGAAYGGGQWPLFLGELRDPLLAALDAHGATSIDTLLFCYGVPYQVEVPGWGPRSIDNALAVPHVLGTAAAPLFKSTQYTNPLKETSPHIGADIGHFDHALHQYQGTTMYLWARLDGLSAEHAKALVDRALYGQAHISPAPGAYGGFGYVDSRFGQYTDAFLQAEYPVGYLEYANGDISMAYGKFFVEQSGFPLRWEPWETEIGEPGASFDGEPAGSAELGAQALFYGGWYNFAKYQHAWEWKSGAFACDLNSNSAQGIRSAGTVSFLAQALQENLTAGAGVIAEPYLNGHNRPEIFLAYILDGFTWAEASAVSDPGVKWMSLHLGDPLYRIDPGQATLDTTAPAPVVWLGADHASLELVLPAVPGDSPGGSEVFRVTAVGSGGSPAVTTTAVVQPDDRRRQVVAVPGATGPGLTWVSAGVVDPSGNAAATPLQHFVGGPAAPSSAVVAVDDSDVDGSEPLVLRYSFGAAGGLLSQVTAFAMTVTLPAKGLVDFPVAPILLPLASGHLLTHSLDQLNFAVVFPPGAWPDGPATFKVSLTADGQPSSGSADVLVGP